MRQASLATYVEWIEIHSIYIINVTKTGDGEGANDQAEPMRIRENLKKLVRDFLSTFRLRVKP